MIFKLILLGHYDLKVLGELNLGTKLARTASLGENSETYVMSHETYA